MITREMVEFILSEFPFTRDSDQLLADRLITFYDIDNKDRIKNANFITRERRRLQMKGLYPASNPVGKRRKALEKIYKSEYIADKLDIQGMVLNHILARKILGG